MDSEVGTKEAAIDIEIVVEFGYAIREIAEQLREQVIQSVENDDRPARGGGERLRQSTFMFRRPSNGIEGNWSRRIVH